MNKRTSVNLLFFSALLLTLKSMAQDRNPNALTLSYGNFNFPKIDPQILDESYPFLELSVNYERTIDQNWGAMIGFSIWFPPTADNFGPSWKKPNDRYSAGPVVLMNEYKTIDLNACYHLLSRKKHRITFSAGPSLCWGSNYYADTPYQFSGRPVAGLVAYDNRKIHYFGISSELKYDYLFLRKRAIVGPDLIWRKHFSIPSYEYIYGIHFGFIF